MTATDLSPRSGAPSLIPEPMVLEARYANLWQEARELEAGQGGGVAPGVGRWIAAVLTLKLSFLPIPRPRNGNTHRTLPAGECIPRMGLLKPSLTVCSMCREASPNPQTTRPWHQAGQPAGDVRPAGAGAGRPGGAVRHATAGDGSVCRDAGLCRPASSLSLTGTTLSDWAANKAVRACLMWGDLQPRRN